MMLVRHAARAVSVRLFRILEFVSGEMERHLIVDNVSGDLFYDVVRGIVEAVESSWQMMVCRMICS